MDKLSLNFFGEQMEVNLPETLASLRKNISDKFCFSPSDTAELIITYAKDLGKKIIKTENDFEEFIKSKIGKIDLDVDPNSQIYQKSLIKLQTETEKDKKELENLLTKSQELKTEKDSKLSEAKKKMDELAKKRKEMEKKRKECIMKFDRDIKKIKCEICKIKKQADTEVKKIDKKKNDLNKSIDEIKAKLGLPVEKKEKKKLKSHKPKPKHKKQEKKELFNGVSNTINKIVTKVNEYIKTEVEKSEKKGDLKENEKKLLDSIKKWSEFIKSNTEQLTNNLSKKYEEYKNYFIPNQQKEIHWNYICDGCNMAPIKGTRYHCDICKDFDFCEKCHTEQKDKHGHNFTAVQKSLFHPPERKFRAPRFVCDKVMHKGVVCDGCGAFPIIGCRFKCAICPNFDYCENCEKKFGKEHSHPLIQISSPDIKLLSIKCQLKEEFKMEKGQEHIDIIHDGIVCDGCNAECIVGSRYKCAVCPNFDYCEKCLKENSSEHKHPFIKIYHPKMKLSSIKVLVDENCPTYIPPVRIIPNDCHKEEKQTEKLKGKNDQNLLVDHDGPVHNDVTCDGCGMYPIVGCRYKCAICPNFDFCEKCEKKFHREHSHPMIQIPSPEMKLYSVKCNLKDNFKMKKEQEQTDIIHEGVSCDGCGCESIVGNRYKCAICQNFDYCEKCLKSHSSDHKHPFIKIYHPKMKLISIKVVVDEKCPIYDNSNSKKIKKEKNEKKQEENEKPIHEGITCDGCGMKNIVGCRYKCAVCPNFDFCEKCEDTLTEKHQHPFIKIYNPEMKLASIKCVVRDDCPIYQNDQ